jgi:hypothetical protein
VNYVAEVAGEIVVAVANQPSLGTLITSDRDQADMAGIGRFQYVHRLHCHGYLLV